MNAMQKRAWAILIAIPFFLVMARKLFVSTSDDFDIRIILYGLVFLGIVALTGLTPIIFQKYLPNFFRKVQKGFEIAESGYRFWTRVDFDERDRLIKQRAYLAGYIAAYSFYGGICVITTFVLGPSNSIPVFGLLLVLAGGLLTQLFVRSLALLIQYGWKGKGEKS